MKSALLQLHAAVFLWGFTGVLGRTISLGEGWLVWWRLCITVISLWLLFAWQQKLHRIHWKDFLKIASIGTILSLHWLFFYGSIKYADVSIALTCLSTSGLFSAIIEPVFFRRRINLSEIVLGLFAIAGIYIIHHSNIRFSAGIYIGLLSSVFYVLVSIMNKKIVTDYKSVTITLYQLTGGFIGLTLLMPVYEYLFPAQEMLPQPLDWLWLVILSWCCTIFTFFLYIGALKKISAFTANLTFTLEPVYGIILAFIIYHENKELSNAFYFGLCLIMLAVFVQMIRIVNQYKKINAALKH